MVVGMDPVLMGPKMDEAGNDEMWVNLPLSCCGCCYCCCWGTTSLLMGGGETATLGGARTAAGENR